jgi:hypothetical protein
VQLESQWLLLLMKLRALLPGVDQP